MTPSSQGTSRTIWSELEAWATSFKPWQRFALGNIVRHSTLTEEQADQTYKQFLHDNALGPAPDPALDIPSSIAGRPATTSEDGTHYLKALSNLRGANALPQDALLLFSPNLTIIYGGNGVGKSGFARVLSTGCFCRNKPTVLPDIYAEGTQPRLDATIVLTTADKKDKTFELSAAQDIPDLKRISVFDTAEARTYLTEQNPLGFKPLGFDIFPELVKVYDKLQARLNAEIALRNKVNIFQTSFIAPESEVSRFVATLSGSTKTDTLDHLASFGEVETARLAEVGRQIVELQTQSVETTLAQLRAAERDLETTQTHLAEALAHLTAQSRANDSALIDRYTSCTAEVAALGEDSFKQGFFKAIGSPQWEKFLLAGKELALLESPDYPHEGDHCIFCLQRLGEESHNRIHRYWTFLESDAKQNALVAKEALDGAAENLERVHFKFFDRETTAYATIVRLRPELAAHLEGLIETATAYRDATIAKLRCQEAEVFLPPNEDLMAPLRELREQVKADIKRLTENDPKEAISNLEAERVLLRHRQVLHQLRDQIASWIADKHWCAGAADAQRSLNPRSVTQKEKELTEVIIAGGYRERLANECAALRCAVPIEMHTQGQRGETVISLKMRGHRPDQILSEGEQRAVALADFLTEVALNPSATGIILDDPVNSQDHRRKHLIAKRLVEESKARQVIIFTHDMIFLSRLVEIAEGDVEFLTHWIDRHSDGRPGLVALNDSPADSRQYRNVDKALGTLVEAKDASGSARHRLVQRGMAS